ncbi:phage replisome organizer N-terminal domain-containing protein [Gracilibacillus sp. YIM 98692]|uniref:phage replisome organizer N-terminal domain-containing protein n=1 Tax=Gracilibacillus sp. YIM 98692 TaxID=2663532 RepID=UPI0013D003F3|nr:phage replisome organizer N-terminal domain-containing protein [Gracilibacillus sp. YIM 98692]
MSNVKWIKLSTQMFEDEKIRLIEKMPEADTILIIWVKLLAQAGKVNASGYIFLSENIPYTDEMLSTLFDRPIGTVRMALKTFQQFGMIEIDENQFISITNWEKHQNIEGLDKIREQTRKRVAKHRERKKIEQKNHSNVTETLSNETEEELERELDKEKDNNKDIIRDLFDHYVSKNIVKHRKLTSPMRTAIKRRLKDYSFKELKKAIDNYAYILNSNNHWFSHKYPLADLMRDKDIRKFLDEADPLNNYLKRTFDSRNKLNINQFDPKKDAF